MKIAVANAKGGVGKTTTSAYLSSVLARDGHNVTLIDADPQQSALLWAKVATLANDPLPFPVHGVKPDDLRNIREKPGEWLVIDAPPSHTGLKAAVGTADLVIIPTTEAALDLQQAWATLQAIDPKPAALLLTRVEPGTRAFRQALEALEAQDTPRFDAIIPKRQENKNGFGHSPAKLWEYGLVLREIEEATRP